MRRLRWVQPAVLAGLVVTLASAASAQACEFHFKPYGDRVTRAVIERDPGLPRQAIPEAQCRKFNEFSRFFAAHGVLFSISSDQFVGSGVSTAWAQVELRDRYGVVSSEVGQSTRVAPDPDDTVARGLRAYAIEQALFSIDLDAALQSLRQSEVKDGLTPLPDFR